MSIVTIAGEARARTARMDIREIVRRLNNALGATLVAALAGNKDRKISYGWAKEDGPVPKTPAVKRLQFAYDQWQLISDAEGEHVARMWFIGSNPLLDDDSPIDAIREDRFQQAGRAARTMVEDGFSG